MSTKSISTSIAHSSCDVCGRTLLRGERAEIYVSGGARRSVCELCTSRALHGGWVREGTAPDYEERGARVDRRRSLMSRFRSWRDAVVAGNGEVAEEGLGAAGAGEDYAAWDGGRQAAAGRESRPARDNRAGLQSHAPRESRQARESRPARESRHAREPRTVREPRHVRAVPTSTEHKISSAVELFNASEHPRTVAGIARSLGLPEVSVLPVEGAPSAVGLLIAWELCWYRYEVDLSDEIPGVRVAGQGYELDELAPEERQPNSVADEYGTLTLAQ